MTQSQRTPTARTGSGRTPRHARPGAGRRTSPTGTARAGRRETPRRRYDEPSFLERFRTPILARRRHRRGRACRRCSCSHRRRRPPTRARPSTRRAHRGGRARPGPARHGQPARGAGDKVTYPVCPPASGKHINQPPRGPIPRARLRARRRGRPQRLGPQPRARRAGAPVLVRQGGLRRRLARTRCARSSTASRRAPICQIPPGCSARRRALRADADEVRGARLGPRRCTSTRSTRSRSTTSTCATRSVDTEGQFLSPPEPQCNPPSPSAGRAGRGEPGAHPTPRARARPRPTPRARARRRRRAEPGGELRPPMRLYAYEDRSGDPRSASSIAVAS